MGGKRRAAATIMSARAPQSTIAARSRRPGHCTSSPDLMKPGAPSCRRAGVWTSPRGLVPAQTATSRSWHTADFASDCCSRRLEAAGSLCFGHASDPLVHSGSPMGPPSTLLRRSSRQWRNLKPQPRRNDKPAQQTRISRSCWTSALIKHHPAARAACRHPKCGGHGAAAERIDRYPWTRNGETRAIRFGYTDGYHDAVNLRERSNWSDPVQGVRAGAVLHRLEGIVRTEVSRIEHDASTGRFEEEVIWHDSYVPRSTCTTMGRHPHPFAGPWSDTPAVSSVRVWEGRFISARTPASDRARALRRHRTGRGELGSGAREHSRRLSGGTCRTRGRTPARSGEQTPQGTRSTGEAPRAA